MKIVLAERKGKKHDVSQSSLGVGGWKAETSLEYAKLIVNKLDPFSVANGSN
jgi:hypothetical protein